MAKRNPLSFNNEELAENLQKSNGKGIDAFFSVTPVTPLPDASRPNIAVEKEPIRRKVVHSSSRRKTTKKPQDEQKIVQPSNHDVMTSSHHESMKESKQSSTHDVTTIESIRKSVKEIGKEQTTHRTTLEEKRAVADIVFAYSHLGIRTSENEIARIAVSFLIRDYNENGENSILQKVLKALNE